MMKKENTATRLKRIMDERGLKQVDVLNLVKPICEKYGVKMNKSNISQYCAGINEPNQQKLVVLGEALGVSEAWLMGFDVDMFKSPNQQASSDVSLIKKFHKIKPEQQDMILKMIDVYLNESGE